MSNSGFAPYRVRDSGWSIDEVSALVNKSCFESPGLKPSRGNLRITVNTAHAFERLMARLAEIPHVEFVTFRVATSTPRPADKIRVVIQHDVDFDTVAAEQLSKTEQRLGIPATYFILHTGSYYGFFDPKHRIFHRHEAMRHYYLALQERGHEVALHNDALCVYQHWLMDGAQALAEELGWLRSCGLLICGTAAHNCAAAYGAENYEIFINGEYTPWEPNRPGDYKHHHEVCCNGRKAPLRFLDPKDLGLSYEGYDLIPRRQPGLHKGMADLVNEWYWSLQLRRSAGSSPPPPTSREYVDEDTLLEDITRFDPGMMAVLNVHPVYFGCRYSVHSGPPVIRNKVTVEINKKLGWETYVPGDVQCCFKSDPAGDSRQNISWANQWGMLDKSRNGPQGKADLRILMLGSDTLDARHVMVEAQCQVLLERFLREAFDREVSVLKLAFPQMGVDRLWSWYTRVNRKFRAGFVIVGIDGDALGKNLPEIWSQRTGFSAEHPPGDYVKWDPVGGKFEVHPRSRGWRIRRAAPRDVGTWPHGGRDLVQTLIEGRGFPVNGFDCLEYLNQLYGFVIDGIRRDGATPILLLEGLGARSPNEEQPVPIDPNSTEGRQLRARLAELAKNHGVDLIDPYDAFADDPWQRQATHGDGSWTCAGHRMAAECVFRHLCCSSKGLTGRPIPKSER